MKTVTRKELIDFILAQPDDRPINMGEPIYPCPEGQCGCIMVHYGHEVLGFEQFHAWNRLWSNSYDASGKPTGILAEFEKELPDIEVFLKGKAFVADNYGQIKKALNLV